MKLTDDTYVYQEIQYLRGVADKLTAYCHNDTCNQKEQCPKDCGECRDKLDLHTAIAWQYARELDVLCKEVEDHDIYYTWLADELGFVFRLSEYVARVLGAHKDKYEELYRLVKDAQESIRFLIDHLYDYIK